MEIILLPVPISWEPLKGLIFEAQSTPSGVGQVRAQHGIKGQAANGNTIAHQQEHIELGVMHVLLYASIL